MQPASTIESSQRGGDTSPGRPLHDLLLTFSELASLLPEALEEGDWLNAYLFVCGMNQIAEDALHCDPILVGAIAEHLRADGRRLSRSLGRGVEFAARGIQEVRSRRLSPSPLHDSQRSLARLVEALADVIAEVRPPRSDELIEAAAELLVSVVPRSTSEQVLRLPSSFQAFDLTPADICELVERFSRTASPVGRPLVVVGVRTSGSYLAPLCASFLKANGYGDVRVLTARPGHQFLGHERAAVRSVARHHGLALVVDDPPGSGRSVAAVARGLKRLSLPEPSIVLLLPVFGAREELPPALRRYPSVLLASEEWAIQSKLTPDAVRGTITQLLGEAVHVAGVRPLPLPARPWRRSHERALFEVDLATASTTVLAEGVGIGYFAEHAAAVALALKPHVPEVYGVTDGCLLREWLPDERRADQDAPTDGLIEAVVRYVVDRSRALPAVRDASAGLARERPVWEVASRLLSRPFGRGSRAAQLLFTDSLAKHLLHVRRPSVVDGQTGLSNWFADERGSGGYVKTGFLERSFWSLGLSCYDPLFDVAGAAVSSSAPDAAERLRTAYERVAGEQVGNERWLLYELAQLWGRERIGAVDSGELARACSRAVQQYIGRIYLADLEPRRGGALCAIDLDGVLEGQSLGFPATTAAGASSLRAMIAHGYRPILVTGRSADEVTDRCVAYRLAGGVAEYGSVVYTTEPSSSQALVSDRDRLLLDRLRNSLSDLAGVFVDRGYRHSVRAFGIDRTGRRRGLDSRTIARGLARVKGAHRLRVVAGATQTDFVSSDVDKGASVSFLAGLLGSPGAEDAPQLALAVGDAGTDLPMLRLAKLPFAPANATGEVRRATGVHVLGRPYQSGLALAVERLIGHPPGRCPMCLPPELTPEANTVLAIISAQEQGLGGLARGFVELLLRAGP